VFFLGFRFSFGAIGCPCATHSVFRRLFGTIVFSIKSAG
jgi:hypothetical protein